MSRLRTLWLGHVLPHPPQGGSLQRSHHLLRAAAGAFDVDLVTFRQKAFHPDAASVEASRRALEPYCRVCAVIDLPADRSALARTALLATSIVTPWPYTVRWNASRAMRRTLSDLASRERYDLVYFDTIGLLPYRDLFPHAAWLLNHQNVESHMLKRRAQRARRGVAAFLRWEASRLAAFERRHGAAAHLHVVVSELDAVRLREVIPDAEVAVVDNPVDVDYFEPDPAIPPEKGSVIFVGRIDSYANAEAVRWMRDEIWPRLRRGDRARSLAIVGRSPPADVRAWAQADPSVTVTGFVDDVRPWMRRAAVYLCPIRDGGGTRLKILDAMAMGLAIVSHPMAIEGLELEPGRHVLVAEDVEGLSRAVERVLSEPAVARALGRAARERVVERYATKAIGARLVAAYERAVDRARVPASSRAGGAVP